MRKMLKALGQGGMALVLTLGVLALITALVVEFAYGVYVSTGFLDNWQSSKQGSLLAKSGVSIASKLLVDTVGAQTYTYPGVIEIPQTEPFGEGAGTVGLKIEDESAKFNLNRLALTYVRPGDEPDTEAFKRLLEELGLPVEVGARIKDWVDADEISEQGSNDSKLKNSKMESTEELLMVPGISADVYDKLEPHVTVYTNNLININSAGIPVLLTLHPTINRTMAEEIVKYREEHAFEFIGNLSAVPGMEDISSSLQHLIVVKGDAYMITSTAIMGDGITRVVRCVVSTKGRTEYWKEF